MVGAPMGAPFLCGDQRRLSSRCGARGVARGPCSSMASTTESSVAGRPLQSLFAPSEDLLPAGAEGSVVVEQVSGEGRAIVFSGSWVGFAAMGVLLGRQEIR
jgi:hypothetical protein